MSTAGRFSADGHATSHVSALLLLFATAAGFGFYLDHYRLVYSGLGIVFGAGFAADHVTRISLWVMVAASAAACVLLALNVWSRRSRWLLAGLGLYVGLYLVAVALLPRLVESFVVRPSELALETPYLKHYIDFTRKAYQLDSLQETAYPALADLTAAVLARNSDTVENIRLWDSRPLLQTYQQTQAIRLYYQFFNVNVDRYHLSEAFIR